MTNGDILKIAMSQSAIDSGCRAEDFQSAENRVVRSVAHQDARKYLELPFACDLTSYGSNIVASVSEELREAVSDYISRFPVEHCFEAPNMHVLIEELKPFGMNVCFMAEYFLPDMAAIKPIECPYETRILTAPDFQGLYLPEWSNGLSMDRPHLDVLGVGAYHQGRLVGLAGCSADCREMWQIGVDVLPDYRKQGVACALTSRLAHEILGAGKVPFYCAAWSNLRSVRNAIKSGFRPAWVQMTVKPQSVINKMNSKA